MKDLTKAFWLLVILAALANSCADIPKGAQGEKGIQGPTGEQGISGPTGGLGATGAIGATGLQGDPGSQGATGEQGRPGSTGPTGEMGATGTQGPSGVDAKSVTIVQLCKDCVPSYPSVFSEIAFCIDSNLYGTYSTNGGFSTLLPPGNYSSDGVNCSCSFTILPICEVQ